MRNFQENVKVVPISPQQQGIWFHAEGSSVSFWNFTQVKSFEGVLDAETFKSAFDLVLNSQSSLRTSFKMNGENLYQCIHDSIPSDDLIEYIEYEVNDPDGVENLVRFELKKEERYEFDLENDFLIRIKVLKFIDRCYIILTMNHIITDFSSMQLFWKQLADYYNSLINGEIPALKVPTSEYHDYSQSHYKHSQSIDYYEHKKYWIDKLVNRHSQSFISFYRNNPILSYREFDLSNSLIQKIRILSLRKRVLYSSVYQLAFFLLLYKYTKSSSISIGNVVNGRGLGRSKYSDVIGLFAKRLVNVLNIDDNDVISNLLFSLNKDILDSFSHEDAPYEEIAREIGKVEGVAPKPLLY